MAGVEQLELSAVDGDSARAARARETLAQQLDTLAGAAGRLSDRLSLKHFSLIDIAEPQGRKTFLRDRELASAIRGYYGARTGMLIAFWGILIGLVLALFLWRKAVLALGAHRAALAAHTH